MTKVNHNYVVGVLKKVGPVQDVTAKFSKRDIYVEIPDGKYNVLAKFQLANSDVNLVNEVDERMKVKVYFKIWGRDKGHYHVQNLNAWRIEFL